MNTNYLLSCIVVLCMGNGFSQNLKCGENQNEISKNFLIQNSESIQITDDPSVRHVFNVMYHVVYNDDGLTRTNLLGQQGLTIGENEVLQSIKNLNVAFNQFNIFSNIMVWIK